MNDEDKLLKILEIETNRVNHLDTILFNIKIWMTTLVLVLIGFVFENTLVRGKCHAGSILFVIQHCALLKQDPAAAG